MIYSKLKGQLDFLFALILIIAGFPFFIIVPLMIKMEDPKGTVLFRQRRIGKNEKEFTLYKFRSMKMELFKDGKELEDNERMLQVGQFIRKTSLDELPQLLNVLKGDMSFIGPRPLLVEYLPHYTTSERCRHDIKPGISGWAQINGRNSLSWEEKFELDVYYVEHLSLILDLKIFLLTVKKVFTGSDVIDPGNVTVPPLDVYRIQEKNSGRKESITDL